MRGPHDLWKVSDTEEEDFGDDTDEWPVDGIVGEEVDLMGVSRYEVRWDNWKRQDGTNTTWTKRMHDRPDLIENWVKYQEKKRKRAAKESTDVVLEPLNIIDVHNIRTAKCSQAIEEKIERRQSTNLARFANWDLVGRASTSRSSTARSESSRSKRSWSSTIDLEDDDPYPHASHDFTFPRLPSLSEKWNSAARATGAASISITNEIDDEIIPPVIDDFEYLENRYSYPEDISSLVAHPEDFLVSCDCKFCTDAANCECQEALDVDHDRMFAYTPEGLFTFRIPPGFEVIECNMNCKCQKHGRCINRVAQKPRDTPIDIFKTEDRGWGARATVDLPKGKVLGIYTGRVIHREELENLVPGHKSYTFNLDAREYPEDEDPAQKYTVDAYARGNWTRFINHSCSPNVQVYPVVYDTIPEQNIPYLAFVTIVDIPAYNELLLDYDPAFVPQAVKGKKKHSRPSKTAVPCACGAANCRGWLQY
ncbi:SET domain-containing protein [Neolentinus lepideus HHB14362 ss-1]|uniref:SET domain-containing protein n=1 Tax=Neolentinus lepideus HHB14362 ss-1 TaxID=1314782 RepID=A0A165RWD0_9AGAM|nr:SET domain-containing protein [Neolentinus lepideus HHB14362 ss-1]